MNTMLTKDIVAETYQTYQNLIWEVVWRFVEKYGGDVDEQRSQANLYFVKACIEFNGSGSLSTWIYGKIWYGLFEDRFHELYRQPRLTNHNHSSTLKPAKHSVRQRFNDIFEQCTTDACYVLMLVFNPPNSLDENDLAEGFNGTKIRMTIKRHLKAMGWTGRRIRETISEIRSLAYD